MPTKKEIIVKKVGQMSVDESVIRDVIYDMGFKEEDIKIPRIGVDGCTPGNLLIWYAAKRCYMAFGTEVNQNISKVRDDLDKYLTNVLKSGHFSVLEHSTMSFSIEGISRVFTGEMNRHRVGVGVSEGSMRYIRLNDLGYWEPFSIRKGTHTQLDTALDGIFSTSEIDRKKEQTRELFNVAFTQMEGWMKQLEKIWELNAGGRMGPDKAAGFTAKKLLTSMFRRLIGMGISTGGTWTMNYRAIRHIAQLRGSMHAEEEIFEVASQIIEIAREEEPYIFGDFRLLDTGWTPNFAKV